MNEILATTYYISHYARLFFIYTPDSVAKVDQNTVETACTTITRMPSNSLDLEALVKTFRNDAMSEDVLSIIRQEVDVKDLSTMKLLESMRSKSRDAYLSMKFGTDREEEQSKFIINSVDAWIDTAQDCLQIVAHASAMGTKV